MLDGMGFERDLFAKEVERLQGLLAALEEENVLPDALLAAQQILGTAANKLEVFISEGKHKTWPTPTVEQPSFSDLWDWGDEYGGCEATDGCWVESDVAP